MESGHSWGKQDAGEQNLINETRGGSWTEHGWVIVCGSADYEFDRFTSVYTRCHHLEEWDWCTFST